MRPLWKGAISFGLVTIPVSLYPATKREELKFRLLRKSDHSPVNYRRVPEADGKEVPWDQIVKGYEYEKGKFVVFVLATAWLTASPDSVVSFGRPGGGREFGDSTDWKNQPARGGLSPDSRDGDFKAPAGFDH